MKKDNKRQEHGDSLKAWQHEHAAGEAQLCFAACLGSKHLLPHMHLRNQLDTLRPHIFSQTVLQTSRVC
jgi:hypothetical protein